MSRLVPIPALLLLAAPVVAQPKLPPDLALVPQDGLGFVHVRVAELWGHESLKDVRDILKKAGDQALAALDKRFGDLPSNVERITMWVGPSTSENSMSDDFLFVVRLARPADPAALRKALLPEGTEKKGKRFAWTSDSIGAALLIADDRTFVLGSLPDVVRIANGTGPAATPLADGLAISAGDRPVTLGFQVPALPAEWRKEIKKETPSELQPVVAARTVTASLDLAGEGHLHVRLGYPTDAAAADVVKLLKAPGGPARKVIAGFRAELEEMVFDNKVVGAIEIPKAAAAALGLGVLKHAEDLLGSDRLKQNGSAVEATVELPMRSKTIVVPAALAAGLGVAGQATQWREEARRRQTRNLQQMLLGLHAYHDTHNKAEAANLDADGKPLLSWRVHLLPYMEEENLYRQFKLNEPWDSEHNKKLIDKMPKIYEIDGVVAKAGETHYRTFVGPKAVWAYDRPLTIPASFPDGTSNSVVFVQAASPVIWTKPDELLADGKAAIKPQLLFRDNRAVVGLGDGSVRFVRDSVGEDLWKTLIDPADGMVIPDDVFKR